MAAPDHAPPHRKPATNGEAPAAAVATEAYEYPSEEPASSHTTPPAPATTKKAGRAAPVAGGSGVKPKKALDPSEVRIGDCERGVE